MTNFAITSDFYRLFETVRIPLVVTSSDLDIVYANRYAHESLPLILETGKRLEIENLLQSEDSLEFENVVSECKNRGESISTLKQKETDKYFKVKAYYLRGDNCEIVFHFEDVSQSRVLEEQYYDHLTDLYNQVETQEREIAILRARVIRLNDYATKL